MKSRLLMVLVLTGLWFPVPGIIGRLAEAQVRPATAEQRLGASVQSYQSRERSAADLECFEGGRQVIIATEYDVHVLVTVLVIAAVVLIVLLI